MKDMLKEKGIIRQFSLVVYPLDLVVVMGDLEEEVNKLYSPRNKDYNWLGAPEGDVAEAVYRVEEKTTGKYCLMVWVPTIDDCQGHYVCHESGHLTLELFRHIGAHIDYDDQEPFCYLLGTMFRLINGTYCEWHDYLEKKKPSKKSKKWNHFF